MSFGQWVLGFIILAVAYFAGIWGFCQIIGSPIIYFTRKQYFPYESFSKKLRKSIIPFIIWVVILGCIAVLELWLFPKYKIFFFIGYGIAFVMSISNIGNLSAEATQSAIQEKLLEENNSQPDVEK